MTQASSAAKKIPHRSDIDGLRAVAVLGVIFFHAGLGCDGGYIGVDVFFVISGFLITSLLLKDLQSDSFSLADFWQRRVRRIVPALAAMSLAVLAAGYWLMLPEDLLQLARSSVAQLCMVSNFYFWRDTGYFALGADTKPLLHTWSLAVEEQFYVLLPVALWALYRLARKAMWSILALVAVVSLGLSVYGLSHSPNFTFFLLPTRAWELLAGSLLAALGSRYLLGTLANESLAAIGLVSIAWAMFFYDERTPFPGLAALPPVVGTGLLILANRERQTAVGKLLSLGPIVFIGTISYALYLWHWPFLALGRYVSDGQLSHVAILFVLLATFIMAVVSLYAVEEPIRRRRVLRSGSSLLTGLACTALVLFGTSVWMVQSGGCNWRLPLALIEPETRTLAGDLDGLRKGDLPRLGTPEAMRPNFIVWGDSHAGVTLPLFDRIAAEHGVSGISASMGGNPPLPGVDISWNADLREWNARILELIERHAIKHVFLVARWASFVEGATAYDIAQGGFFDQPLIYDRHASDRDTEKASELFQTQLTELCQCLVDRGAEVYILQQAPEQTFHPLRRAFLAYRTGGWLPGPSAGVSRDTHQARQARVNACFASLQSAHIHVIDYGKALFRGGENTQLAIDEKLTYRDSHHLTAFGVDFALRPELEPIFAEMNSDATSQFHLGQIKE